MSQLHMPVVRLQNKAAQPTLRLKEGHQKAPRPINAKGELEELKKKVEKVTELFQKKRIHSKAP